MSEPDSLTVVEAFLEDLSRRSRVDAELISRYRALAQDFVWARQGRTLDELDAGDIERHVSTLGARGETFEQLAEARTAARAFLQFVREGGLDRVRSAGPDPTQGKTFNAAALERMREDLRRVWSSDGLAFALAVTAPVLLTVFGGTMGLLGRAVHYAGLAGTYFLILAHVAEGHPGLPQGASENLARSLWRAAMVTLVAVLPAFLANIYVDSWGFDGAPLWAATFAGGLLGALLLPAAVLAVYASDSGLAALAPHLWYRIVTRIPRPYARVASLYVVLVAALTLWRLVIGLSLGSLPTLAMLVYAPVACGLVFAMATGLGGVIERNRFTLGL